MRRLSKISLAKSNRYFNIYFFAPIFILVYYWEVEWKSKNYRIIQCPGGISFFGWSFIPKVLDFASIDGDGNECRIGKFVSPVLSLQYAERVEFAPPGGDLRLHPSALRLRTILPKFRSFNGYCATNIGPSTESTRV